MKKLVTFIVMLFIFLLLPMKTFSDSTSSCPKSFKFNDGYYIGVAAGYDIYKMKNNIVYQNTESDNTFNTNPQLTVNGMMGDFIFGYGKFFGTNANLYFGFELFANGSAADSDFQNSVSSIPLIIDVDVVVNGSFGAGVIPGIRINNNTLIYLKVGYNWSTITLDQTIRSEVDFALHSIEYHDDATINGLLYGIGIESAFNERFNLRAEYTHSLYDSFTSGAGTKISSTRNQFLLGLIYRFNS